MQHFTTIFAGNKQREHTGCGECQTSCQSACKTSCTVANQHCEQANLGDSTLRKASQITRVKTK